MLIDHIIRQELGKQKYQKNNLLNIKQAAEEVGIEVESLRYHIKRGSLTPVCTEKQYPDSRVPVFLFSDKDVQAFKESKHLYANNKSAQRRRKKDGSKKRNNL